MTDSVNKRIQKIPNQMIDRTQGLKIYQINIFIIKYKHNLNDFFFRF